MVCCRCKPERMKEAVPRCFLFYPQHPIADADVRLDVLLPIFSVFQLFAQSCHEHPQGGNIIFPTAAPDLLRYVGVGQNFTHIFGEQAQQLVFDGRQVQFRAIQIRAACRIVDFQRAVSENGDSRAVSAFISVNLRCVTLSRASSSSTEKGLVR